MTEYREVPIASLIRGIQPLSECIVQHHVDRGVRGDIVVFEDQTNGELVLADGHHRVEASVRLGRSVVRVEIGHGDRHAATRLSFPPAWGLA